MATRPVDTTSSSTSPRRGDQGSAPEPSGPTGRRFDERWIAMFVVLFGTFMVVLDTTVVNLGLASLQREFQVGAGIEWVLTSYLAAVGVAQTASGWMADRFGRKRIFIAAMAGFTVTSLACALAWSFEVLVAARVFQGLAGGMLMPVAMAMIYELFEPTERGQAMGYFGIAMMVAPAIGPVLSGTLITSLSWRWLFLINVPIGLVGVPVAIMLLRDSGVRRSTPFDAVGLLLAGTSLTTLLVGVSQGSTWGWASPATVSLLVVGLVLGATFVFHVRRSSHPLIDLTIMAKPVFALGMAAIALMTVAQYGRLVFIPLQLSGVREVAEIRVGLVMLPSALGMAVTMPIGGRLVDRIGARIPVSIGAGVLGLSFVAMAQITLTTPLLVISAILFVGGLGSGMAMMSPNIVAMNSVETRRVAQATALSSVSRQVAAAVGVAILAAVFASAQAANPPVSPAAIEQPYHTVFWLSAALLAVAVVVAQFLPGKAQALELQAQRAAEMDQVDGPGAASHVEVI
ncbi:MAG: DHA2 family efflux MFS transporter permease subunit [Acidimicrobiales bacterium]